MAVTFSLTSRVLVTTAEYDWFWKNW